MKKLRLSSIDETLLEILAYALFGNQKPLIYLEQIEPLLREARLQSVYPLVYSSMEKDIKEKLDSSEYAKYDKLYLKYIMSCAQNFEEHNELDGVLQEAQIPYCVIKGVASAAYYTQPFLRSVGDVDFLIKHVHKEDVSALIKKIGFEAKKTDNDEVQEKAKAAIKWCQCATEVDADGKTWEYRMIPGDKIIVGNTLKYVAGLAVIIDVEE